MSPHSASATFPGENGKIAFVGKMDGNEEIYVINEDGTGLTRLTNNNYTDLAPKWSPDGTKMTFEIKSAENDRDRDIYAMNADGTGVARLTDDALLDANPLWSPDGTTIAFTRGADGLKGNHNVFVMKPDGSA